MGLAPGSESLRFGRCLVLVMYLGCNRDAYFELCLVGRAVARGSGPASPCCTSLVEAFHMMLKSSPKGMGLTKGDAHESSTARLRSEPEFRKNKVQMFSNSFSPP